MKVLMYYKVLIIFGAYHQFELRFLREKDGNIWNVQQLYYLLPDFSFVYF